jgi:hypothetical protein
LKIINKIAEIVEDDIKRYDDYQKTDHYLKKMPINMGGQYEDAYYFFQFARYKAGLDACQAAINASISQLSEQEMEMLREPFPIMLVTTLPWQIRGTDAVLHFDGPLALGKDIPFMFVPEAKVLYVEEWVKLHVPGKKKPQVLALEELTEHFLALEELTEHLANKSL